MAAGVHQSLYKVVVFMHIRRLLTPLPKIDSNVVGDGFKRMPYYNVLKCKVFSAHLLPYAINTCVIQVKS